MTEWNATNENAISHGIFCSTSVIFFWANINLGQMHFHVYDFEKEISPNAIEHILNE